MPYWVQRDVAGGNWIESSYDPPMAIGLKRPYLQGQPLTEEYKSTLSKVLIVKKPRKNNTPPDMIQDGLSAIWIVCESVKNKLELLEPEIHEYIPIQVKRDDNSEDYGTYYVIILRQFLDAIDYEKTEFKNGFGREAAKRDRFSPFLGAERKRTLKSEVISGHHLWRGAVENSRGNVFCSDELANFVVAEGLKGWEFWPCETD